MKNSIIIFLLQISFTHVLPMAFIFHALPHMEQYVEKTYCDGWEDGYCEGWRDVKGEFAICPVTPVCPTPEVNKTTYTDGYNRGFKAGAKKAKS